MSPTPAEAPKIDKAETPSFDVKTDSNKVNGEVEKTEGFYISKRNMKIGAGVLATLIVIGSTIAIISNSNKREKDTTIQSIDNSEPTENSSAMETNGTEATTVDSESLVVTLAPSGTSGETNPETQIDYTLPPVNIVESYAFETLTSDQQTELIKMEVMSNDEFQALPETTKLKFDYWVLKNFKGRFDQVRKVNNLPPLTYKERPKTAEDYASNNAYLLTFSACLRTWSGKDGEGIVLETELAKKIQALAFTATDEHIKDWNALMDSYAVLGPMALIRIDQEVEGFEVRGADTIVNIYMKSNETITIAPGTEHGQFTFKDISFDAMDGTKVTISTCSFAVRQGDQNYIQNIGQ